MKTRLQFVFEMAGSAYLDSELKEQVARRMEDAHPIDVSTICSEIRELRRTIRIMTKAGLARVPYNEG